MSEAGASSNLPVRHRPDIDGLRALAIVPVLLFHANLGVPGGFVGVDVFFVISGYLITGLINAGLSDGSFSLLDFYYRRAKRIFPAMVVMLAAVSLVAAIVLTPSELTDFGNCLICVAGFVANLADRMRGGYFASAMETNPLLHMWSLALEEQFYVLWPLLLAALSRPALARWRLWAVGGVIIASLTASCLWLRSDAIAGYYVLSSRAFELAIGAFAALAPRSFRSVKLSKAIKNTASLVGLGLILFACAAYDAKTLFPGIAALAPCCGAALIILSSETEASVIGRILASKPLVWIGLISYSLYLWHWPVIVFTRLLFDAQLGPQAAISALAVTVAIAWASFAFIETPTRHFKPKPQPQARESTGKSQVIVAAAMAVCMLVAVGDLFTSTHGLPSRNPANHWDQQVQQENHAFQTSPCLSRTAALPTDINCTLAPRDRAPARHVVVWGDSHAMQLRPVMDTTASADEVSIRMVTKAGCPPLIGVSILPSDSIRLGCRSFNASATEAILADPKTGVVVLAARWDSYAAGQWLVTRDGIRPSITQSRALFVSSLRQTLLRMTNAGRRVVLVAQVPMPAQNADNCYVRAKQLGLAPTRCQTTMIDRQQRVHTDTLALLSAASNALAGVTILDPFGAYCHDQACVLIQGDRPLYLDDMHLSAVGAGLLSTAFQRALAQGAS